MPIPDYQSIMLPLLRLAGDTGTMALDDAVDALAEHFDLTDQERRDLYPTGLKRIFKDRVAWARTYLRQAGLLSYPERRFFQITELGIQVLNERPLAIDVRYLMRFPEFVQFIRRSRRSSGSAPTTDPESQASPRDLVEEGYRESRRNLEAELLIKVKEAPPAFFEQLVIDLLMAMGYGGSRSDAGQALGRSGDGGIDGVISQDRLGLDVVYVQAKRWDRTQVGEREIRDFVGALEGRGAGKGILITTSQFAGSATDYVSRIAKRVILVDGETLAVLMVDHGVGVSVQNVYEIKQVDNDYFLSE